MTVNRTAGRSGEDGAISLNDPLNVAIAQAQRRIAVCEARYHGLVRAMVSGTSVLWYAHDAELQREFESAFDAGRALRKC